MISVTSREKKNWWSCWKNSLLSQFQNEHVLQDALLKKNCPEEIMFFDFNVALVVFSLEQE
jgi:hypothetical protein